MKLLDSGILYVASSEKYFHEALISLKSVKGVGISLPTAIFVSSELVEEAKVYFDYVFIIQRPEKSFVDKIVPLRDSPFTRTLFLDTDTKVYEDITDLYKVLNKFDLAFSVAPIRNGYSVDVPAWFLEPNTGVILYKKSPELNKLIEKWLEIYREQLTGTECPPHDQSSFRLALYNSSVSFYILGCEYNFRSVFPCVIPGNSSIKIFHDRQPKTINDSLYIVSSQNLGRGFKMSPKVFLPDLHNVRSRVFVARKTLLRLPSIGDLSLLIWSALKRKITRTIKI